MILPLRTLLRHALSGAALFGCAASAFATDYFALPAGAGAQDGSSWANAWPQAQIQTAITALQPGDTLNLGSGTYTLTALSITGSGMEGNPKTILGVDTGNGQPVFQGNFNINNSAGGAKFINIPGEAHHWVFKNLTFKNHPWVVSMALTGTTDTLRTNMTFENLYFDSVEDCLRFYNASQVAVINCHAVRYTKKAFRIGDYSSFITYDGCSADCTGGDPDFPGRAIPVGFGGDDTNQLPIIHDIIFRDCVARNNGYAQGSSNYWNGDGFSTERGTYNVQFIRCKAYGNNDGGFDNKASNILYQDCVAAGNSRGFRHWADGGQMFNCVAAYNLKKGGTGSTYGIWVSKNGGELAVDFSTIHGDGNGILLESGGTATATVSNSIISITGSAGGYGSAATFINTATYRPGEGTDPRYVAADPAWEGEPLNAMDSQTYGLTKGYSSARVDETPNTPPTVTISATPLSGTAPLNVAFTATAGDVDGTVISTLWTFGDGQVSTDVNPTATYSAPGTYTAICTVTDNRGAKTSASVEITATPPTVPVEMRIESGGSASYTDTLGRFWAADHSYTISSGGGAADRGAIEIANTADDRIYQTERYGIARYAVLVANGTYTVNLHLAETYTGTTAAGQRVFSVTAEGAAPAGWTDIDIFAEAGGRNLALVKPGTITVTDNVLDLVFTGTTNFPIISGLEILPVAGGDLPPAPPSGLTAADITTNSFSVSWSPATDDVGVASYDVLLNGVFVGNTTGTSFAFTGLAPYATYGVAIRTRDLAGNGSVPSAPLPVKTLNDGTVGNDVIIDNTDPFGADFEGTWPSGTFTPGFYDTDYQHDNNAGKGDKLVTFTPDLPTGGNFTIYLWWTADNNRASNVPVQIVHAGGTTNLTVNQRTNGGAWFSLGTYALAAGTANIVTLSNAGTNGFVIADAIRFLRNTPDTTPPSVPSGLSASGLTSASFTLSWTAASDDLGVTGYEVFLNGVSYATPAGTSASISGLSPETTYSLTVRARDAAGNWSTESVPLAVTTPAPSTGGFDLVVDNADASGVTITGTWLSSSFSPGYHGTDYLHDDNTGKGSKSVRFTPLLPTSGDVTVYLRWISSTSRANNVPVDIIHANGTTTVTVNQRENGQMWVPVGTYAFDAGTTGSVLIRTTGTNGHVIADAVRFESAVTGGGDNEVPSTPSGLAAGGITSSGFTLSWNDATDNVGVTGYEVFLDGVSAATPTGTSATLSGLAPETAYSVTVRARDAAGNWSAESPALSVTTTAASGGGGGSGAAISVNLTNGAANSLAPADVVGAVPVANWNNSAAANQTLSNVIDSTGAATTADISFGGASFGYVNNTPELADPMTDDAKMMRSQRAQSNSSSTSMVAAQVPYAAYDVYVYWGGRVASETVPLTMTVNFQLWDGAAWATSETKFIRDTNRVWDGTYDESTATVAADAVDGQEYVVFRNVTAATFRLAVTSGNRTGICGMQIVEHGATPPPPPAAPAITSAASATGSYSTPFAYQIVATGNPTGYAATGLPAGLVLDSATGAISGTPTIAGSFTVGLSATNAGGTGTASLALTIAPAAQTITFPNPGAKTFGDAPFALAATASSDLPVTYAVASGPATLSGDTVTLTGAGDVTLTATQAGNASFQPAAPVGVSFTVARKSQTITFPNPGAKTFGDDPFSLTATASSGLPVAYVVTSGPATLNDDTVTLTGAGTVTLTATQAGDVDTLPADPTPVSFEVAQAPVEFALAGLWQLYDGQPKSVTVTTTPADLAVTLTYNGSATPPIYPGSYAIEVVVDDANYTGSASESLIVSTDAVVRHAPTLNGRVLGSVHVLSAESVTLNGGASISGDLLVPGLPATMINGQPTFGGVIDGPGLAEPATFSVTLNGQAALRHLVRRIDAVELSAVDAPPAPAGTRDVTLNNANQDTGDFATLRDLTLNGNAGVRPLPPGTYGSLTANGTTGFILGIAGSDEPAVYNLQRLTLNGNSTLQIAGPVILTLANDISVNGEIGTAGDPELLLLRIAAGGLTLNGSAALHGFVHAPSGAVTINGNAELNGGVVSDTLVVNGNGLLAGEAP